MTLIDELKMYLRIDGDEENSSLILLVNAAVSYLKNAGVKIPDNFMDQSVGDVSDSLYRLAILMLTTHYYENRTVTATSTRGEILAIPYGLQSIILQLKAEALLIAGDTV